ncbi:CSC1-like protein At3g54510 isoform X7 [Juglans microcarpa x Juglans regia]|uniref:CSC1-like protein At3g54510 isoform X7 n=1 Tax=Juglans microcarpa x Juglans regia TaxID=2249226 RepID=UPI001B7E9063|nr:CSC1-like protein At3g54510 isoform X7 [Juglans microcarpa x Juglans regia]
MNTQSLFASAAINIGLAFVVLSLFAILKKQPSNAPIYYARRLSKGHNIHFHHSLSIHRFFPSVSWIPRAFRVTEDEILETGGLDALVIIRLFKFGIKFFVVCSLVGLAVLIPVNYNGQDGSYRSYHSMDSFTISNISRGSNRLWVHFSCLWFISLYGLYLLYEAESIARKIKDLREGPMANKHKRERLLLDASQEYAISLQQEKLQVFCEKIRQLQREIIIKQKELPVAFVIFKSRWGAALAAQSQQHPHPLLWITEMAPEPRDVSWRSLVIPYRILWLYKIGVVLAASVLTIFFAIPVTAVQGIARFEKLKKWFPPAMAVQLIPGLSSILTGYLPSVILKGFIYIVPFAMLGMAKAAGCISKSKEEIKACNMVFYFLVGNVFFLSVLSGSLLDEIGESFTHPKDFPSHLAGAVSAQADFFMTYILTDGLSGFSLEILQPGLLFWDVIKSITFGHGKKKNPYLYSLPYFRIIPMVSLSVLIGTVYAVVAPFLLPFLIGYFSLGYAVYVNQIEDVYETVYETCGQYWPYIHLYIVIAIILMQITMIGLFGLKSKPAASILTIPLLLFTLMFNEYCKKRFLPTFHHYPVQVYILLEVLVEKPLVLLVVSFNTIILLPLLCNLSIFLQAAAITWQDLFSLVISNFLITFVLSLWVEKAGLLAFRCTSNLQFALQKLFFLDGLNLLQLFFLDGLSVF